MGGAVAMVVLNSLFMALPVMCYFFTLRVTRSLTWSLGSFVIYWLAFEKIHLTWDISWPWLTLGNAFAMKPEWVQWYEYTGKLGGSLWVLMVNVFIFSVWNKYLSDSYKSKVRLKMIIASLLLILLPMIFSSYIYHHYNHKGESVEVVVVQPNIDPYKEKFEGGKNYIPVREQVDRFISMSKEKLSDSTAFLLWPETAIDINANEEKLTQYRFVREILNFKSNYPELSLLTGLTTYKVQEEKKKTSTSRFRENIGYYDVYNTGLFIDKKNQLHFYHKSKLVPGVEIVPYPEIFNNISYAFDLGGTVGSLGIQDERSNFNSGDVAVAPAICYESVYDDFMAEYVKKGSQIIFLITNDGWWENTEGHKQHLRYASLLAVSTRRSIARCANTGISAFIDQRGNITKATKYWEPAVIRSDVELNEFQSVFVRYGDYIGRMSEWFALFILISTIVRYKIYGIRKN